MAITKNVIAGICTAFLFACGNTPQTGEKKDFI